VLVSVPTVVASQQKLVLLLVHHRVTALRSLKLQVLLLVVQPKLRLSWVVVLVPALAAQVQVLMVVVQALMVQALMVVPLMTPPVVEGTLRRVLVMDAGNRLKAELLLLWSTSGTLNASSALAVAHCLRLAVVEAAL